MELVPLLVIGFVVGLLTGTLIGGPATGYLASIVVGTAGTLIGVGANSLLGIPGAGETWAILVLGILGSAALRLAMLAAASRRLPRPGGG